MQRVGKAWNNFINRVSKWFSNYCEKHGGRGHGRCCPGCAETNREAEDGNLLIDENVNKPVVKHVTFKDVDDKDTGRDHSRGISGSRFHRNTYRQGQRSRQQRFMHLSLHGNAEDKDRKE